MPKYLAVISGTAAEYSFGGNMPYDVNKEIRFEAENGNLARKEANKYLSDLRKELLCPQIFLKSLDQVASVPLD